MYEYPYSIFIYLPFADVHTESDTNNGGSSSRSVVDPEWFFSDMYLDPTFQLVSDPHPDPILDPT